MKAKIAFFQMLPSLTLPALVFSATSVAYASGSCFFSYIRRLRFRLLFSRVHYIVQFEIAQAAGNLNAPKIAATTRSLLKSDEFV